MDEPKLLRRTPSHQKAEVMTQQIKPQLSICRLMPNFQTRLHYAEHYVTKQLQLRGHRTTFVTTNSVLHSLRHLVPQENIGVYWDSEFSWLRVKSVTLGHKPLVSIRLLKSLIRSKRYNIFHLSGVGVPLSIQFLLAHRLCRSDTPVVISDHTTSDTSSSKGLTVGLYYRLLRWSLAGLKDRIAQVASFCPESCDLLSDRFALPRDKCRVIPLGYDANIFHFRPTHDVSKSQAATIGFAGKPSSSKRLEDLIRAVGIVGQDNAIELRIAGLLDCAPTLRHDLLNLAASLNVKLVPLPLLPATELARFYNELHLAVFPGSISVTTLEASGCGTPVLIRRSIEGIASRVENGRGHLFDTFDELVALIRTALTATETEEQRRQRSLATAQEFGWENLATKYEELYLELLDG